MGQQEVKTGVTDRDERIAAVISQIGHSGFYQAVAALVRTSVFFDNFIALYFERHFPPRWRGDSFSEAYRETFLLSYLEEAYKLDPFFCFFRSQQKSGVFRIGDLTEDRLYASPYYHGFYEQAGIGDEMGFIFYLGEERAIHFSLGRPRWRSGFTFDERQTAQVLFPLLSAAVSQHESALLWKSEQEGSGRLSGLALLTGREREVLAQLRKGRSGPQIAKDLQIGLETVRSHRKRIYHKMGVTCLYDLLARI